MWEELDCVGFVYKIVKITPASSDMQWWWPSAGILCMEYGIECRGSNRYLAVHFDINFFPCQTFK